MFSMFSSVNALASLIASWPMASGWLDSLWKTEPLPRPLQFARQHLSAQYRNTINGYLKASWRRYRPERPTIRWETHSAERRNPARWRASVALITLVRKSFSGLLRAVRLVRTYVRIEVFEGRIHCSNQKKNRDGFFAGTSNSIICHTSCTESSPKIESEHCAVLESQQGSWFTASSTTRRNI
jgi:hypothetical protein